MTVTCTDPDGDSSDLVLVATSSDTDVATVSGSDGSYTIWSGWNTGTATITVTATDVDGLTGSTSFTMTIVSNPPVCVVYSGATSYERVTVETKATANLSLRCSDPEGDPFTLAVRSAVWIATGDLGVTSSAGGHDRDNALSVPLTVTGVATGQTQLTVTTTDENEQSWDLFLTVTVTDPA